MELLGRVGIDPEMKYTQDGSSRHQAQAGHGPLQEERRRFETDWHTVVVWGKQGEAVNRYVARSARGSTWRAGWSRTPGRDDDGQRRYSTEVHASEVVFLDSSSNAGDNGNGNVAQAPSATPF